MTVPSVFEAASEIIRARGWCQGYLGDDGGWRDINGAIREAAVDEAEEVRAHLLLSGLLRRKGFRVPLCSEPRLDLLYTAAGWNDAPDRWEHEVHGLLAEAHAALGVAPESERED